MILILGLLYWPSFVEHLKKSHENIKSIILQSHVSNLDQKKNSKFSYCYTGLGAGSSVKEVTDSFFRRAFKKIKKIQSVYFAVVI